MDEQEEIYGKPLFYPVESETIVLELSGLKGNEELTDFSNTEPISLCYGAKSIVVNEFEIEGLDWLEE